MSTNAVTRGVSNRQDSVIPTPLGDLQHVNRAGQNETPTLSAEEQRHTGRKQTVAELQRNSTCPSCGSAEVVVWAGHVYKCPRCLKLVMYGGDGGLVPFVPFPGLKREGPR